MAKQVDPLTQLDRIARSAEAGKVEIILTARSCHIKVVPPDYAPIVHERYMSLVSQEEGGSVPISRATELRLKAAAMPIAIGTASDIAGAVQSVADDLKRYKAQQKEAAA